MTGNVTDETGAALRGAKVAAVNTETGVVKATTTDERGAYLLVDLQPGTYTVTIEAPRFRPLSRKDARLTSTASRMACSIFMSSVFGLYRGNE